MSGCVEFESSMTGSTRTGPLEPPLNSALLPNDNKSSPSSLSSPSTADSSSSSCFSDSSSPKDRLDDSFLDIFKSANESTIKQLRQEQTPMRQKMTPVRPQTEQPIQLTPLWEHVVRTRRFPSEVNTRETFDEITQRLKDPEWEVRQHALRVLVDVLPTLDREIVDDTMTNVLTELVNNLGHVAPAVRKGALDTLRVYLVCSRRKDDIVEGILDDALGHQDSLDNFQANVTRGVILSIPSLLFPSSSTIHSKDEILRRAIDSLVSRLVQVTHQEASIRSLSKINEHLGDERFNVYLEESNLNARRDYELLRDVYGVKTCDKNGRERKIDKNKRGDKTKEKSVEEFRNVETRDTCKDCDNEKVSMRINEDNGNKEIDLSLMTRAPRILLETEIKLNEETAIMMTIIEREKDNDESDDDSDFDSGDESTKNHDQQVAPLDSRDGRISNDDGIADEWIETRKTPRRVHFGGEIVKLRTPDSDDSELFQREELQQSRIPIPVSAGSSRRINSTVRTRRSRSNPCSPNIVKSRNRRKTKSVSNSPKREFYTHDASLSPKKSILAKIGVANPTNPRKTLRDGQKKMEDRVNELFGKEENDSAWAFEIYDNDNFPDFNHDDLTINSRGSTINREITTKRRHSMNNRRNSEIGKVRINDSEEIEENGFLDSSLDLIESTTIKSATSTGNREIVKKKRDPVKLKNEERRNSEIGKIRIQDTEEMIEEIVFPDSSLDTIELTIKSATPTGNREISKKKRDSVKLKNEERRNSEIGKIRIQDTEEMIEEIVFPDSSLDTIELTIKSATSTGNCEISKKRRDLAKLKNEERRNSEIGKIRVQDTEEMTQENVFPDSSLNMIESATIKSTTSTENREISKKKRDSAKLKNEERRNSEIGKIRVQDTEEMTQENVFPDSSFDMIESTTIKSTTSTENREISKKKRDPAKLKNEERRNSEIGKNRVQDTEEMTQENVFPDSSLDMIESTTIKSTTSTENREISKKKRDPAKLKNEERRNSEIGKNRVQDTEEMTQENVFPDSSLDMIESTTIKSTTSTENREISKKKRDSAKLKNEERRNSEIGKNRVQDTEEMTQENVFPDSSLNMIESTTIKSTTSTENREISKKKHDLAKLKNEERRNSEIGKNRIIDTEEMIEEMVFPDSSLESMSNSKENRETSTKEKPRESELSENPQKGEKMIDDEKIGSNLSVKTIESGKNSNRGNSTKKRTRSKIVTNNEKSGLSKGSDDSKWESFQEDFPDMRKENGEQTIRAANRSRNKRERKGSLPTENREKEVCEKLEKTSSERNVRSLSLDSQSRSPKKLVFETFPRKERNYILMELSSPVKTNNDKKVTNENTKKILESEKSKIPENNSSLSRQNSTLISSTQNLPNNSTIVDSIVVESNDNVKNNEMPFEDIPDGKKRSYDEEANPLPDIIINETTKFRESNWEELGLVDQEVINDLHNKDDWRARVRGLERVASALRTSSALMAIESRLGSLLQAVLGGERSCRVAAAGMAVARVVVAGVSEEALKRRLPQVAWGLARQGGPNAAQLARVAMLRLRPALMLEQLLQPHCIKARNAKTRENALQLLIFSLVTFPSTEFKVENVAYKVASMVGDRRRRVRQAALDTLAVLAQIYEPEEVTRAGKLAAKGQQDGDSMVAAIRARLARKSLPMVSADGLVVYGLQISPTVQIATGPDVDWIVAGSGSVSPGTGRTRGQIIATTTRQGVQEKNAKNEATRSNSSAAEPNFVALGVGLETKNDQTKPLAWQLVQNLKQNESLRTREKWSATEKRDENFGLRWNEEKSRLTGTLRQYRSASERLDDSFPSSESNPLFIIDDKDLIMKQRKTEENFHRRMDEIYAERNGVVPISQDIVGKRLESRIPIPHSRERETSINDPRIGISYPRRRIIREEEGNSKNWSASSRVSDISRPQSTLRNDQERTYQKSGRDSSPQRSSQTRESYRSIYRQGRGFADGNVFREVQTAPTTTSYDVTRRRQSIKESSATRITNNARRIVTSNAQTSTRMILDEETRSRGNSSFYNGAKSVEEEEYDENNKRHFSVQANSYKIQESNDRASQCSARINNGTLENWSNASSDVSRDRIDGPEVMGKINDDLGSIEESRSIDDDDDIRVSSSKCPNIKKSFDVITHETNPSRRNSIDYGISSGNGNSGGVVYTTENENIEYEETDKDSSNDDNASLVPRDVERLSSDENFETKNHDYPIDDTRIEKSWNIENEDCDVGTSKDTVDNNSGDSSDFGVSKVSEDSPISNESCETDVETFDATNCPARVVSSTYAILSIEEGVGSDNARSSTDENDEPEVAMSYREYKRDSPLKNVVRVISPSIEIDTIVRTEEFVQRAPDENTISIVDETDRSHSRENNRDYDDAVSFRSIDSQKRRDSVVESSIVTKIVEKEQDSLSVILDESINRLRNFDVQTGNEESATTTSMTSTSMMENFSSDSTNRGKINHPTNTGNETAINVPEINGARASTSEKSEFNRKIGTSRVPRIRQKSRANIARVAPMQPILQSKDRNSVARSRTSIQQCFVQLESTDWEIAVKGLKELSTIARQEPEQLDSCSPGTIGRLLGRHVRNLRSQVSRAACLAAGDVFSSQARCIDQDLDDIAGPLLHRTADTNKFLRADSNDALDRMVENLPPNKTIGVIVHRGATHQNAIVRATTARLLASIVDRVGSDWIMSLPREGREKLIASSAKLLMDGNLDARNNAKQIFRKLSRCDGFRKLLKDSVPEATLRHIDKTLKSL